MAIENKVNYMLRRVLPMWKPQEAIDEVVNFCKSHKIDEIMWKDESSGAFHELLTINEVNERTLWLHKAAENLRRIGVRHSINVMTSMGHGEYGQNAAERHPGIEFFCNYHGVKSKSCACPLSDVWQNLIIETYKIYAGTHPVRIWVEDDFRLFNHGPAGFGCCCEKHISEFSRRIGKSLTLEQLREAVLQPGQPHPWRALWLQFQEECMLSIASKIKEAVQKVSPETQIGWMSVTPFMVELEGRGFNAQLKAFAGNGSAAIRMPTTDFQEATPRGLLIADEGLKRAIVQLPEGTVRCTEVESFPHSLYSKSAAWIEAQMTWACVLNVPNQTLNVFDYIGTPISVTPNIPKMLKTKKAFLESVAQKFCRNVKFNGIGLLSNPYSSYHAHSSEGKNIPELLAKETGWANVLRGFGMPVACSDNEIISAVTGQALRRFGETEIKQLFSRGVLLDLSALQVLDEMGFSDLAGVKIKGSIVQCSRPVGPEHLTDPEFGGGKHKFTWMYRVSDAMQIGILEPVKDAKVISSILDPDLNMIAPGVIIYKNKLGGRVAVYPHDFSGKNLDEYIKGIRSTFYSEYRREQIQTVVRWLGKGFLPLMVHADGWVLPHRSDLDGETMLAAMNLNYDSWNNVKLECSVKSKVKKVQVMTADGKWKTNSENWRQHDDIFEIEIKRKIPTFKIVAVTISFQD